MIGHRVSSCRLEVYCWVLGSVLWTRKCCLCSLDKGLVLSGEQCLGVCSGIQLSSKILPYAVKNTNIYTTFLMDDCWFEGWAVTVLLTSLSHALIRDKVLSLCNSNSEIFHLDSLEKQNKLCWPWMENRIYFLLGIIGSWCFIQIWSVFLLYFDF